MSKQIATNDENARSNIIQTPTTSFKDQNEIIQGSTDIDCILKDCSKSSSPHTQQYLYNSPPITKSKDRRDTNADKMLTVSPSPSTTTSPTSDVNIFDLTSVQDAIQTIENEEDISLEYANDMLNKTTNRDEDCNLSIFHTRTQIENYDSIADELRHTLEDQYILKKQLNTLKNKVMSKIRLGDEATDDECITIAHLNKLSPDDMRKFILKYIPSDMIGQAPLYPTFENMSHGDLHLYFVQHYIRFACINEGVITAKVKYVIQKDSNGKVKLRKILKPQYSFLVERESVQEMVEDMWTYHTKTNEDLCSNGDKWGVYQTLTMGSIVKLWNGLLSDPWLKELGDKRLMVSDVGSGMNAFCTIGSLLSGRIGVAVGLEASEHRCFLAADTALGLIYKGYYFQSVVGLLKQDFESPTLSVCGADLLFFWDRAYTLEMCIAFYKVMHNTIDASVLFVQSGYRIGERLPHLQCLFKVEQGPSFKLAMKGSQSIDTVHLFRLTKRTDVSSELPSSTDPSIFELARDKFSKQNREEAYIKIIDECEESCALPSRKKRKAS